MTEQHPEDLPWNDQPADDEALPGSLEPDPAEVVGEGEAARDLRAHRVPGEHESLDERLSEEEPEVAVRGDRAAQAPELMAGESGDDDVAPGEPDVIDPVEAEEPAAEDAAVRIVDDDRV